MIPVFKRPVQRIGTLEMHPYVSRILLVAVTVALVVSAIALWRPWEARRGDLEYVGDKLRARVEVLEKGALATLDVGVQGGIAIMVRGA